MRYAVNIINKSVARILIVTMTCMSGPMLQARAEIVSTDQVVVQRGQSADRARVEAMLAREDVRNMLEDRGVSVEQARNRVASLSDEEVSTLAGRMDSLPAGGDGIIGAIVFVFIVLLITDILGLTKVFPFTRSIR